MLEYFKILSDLLSTGTFFLAALTLFLLREKIGKLIDFIQESGHFEVDTKWLKARLIARDISKRLTLPPSAEKPDWLRVDLSTLELSQVDFPWTDEHETALALHTGPHRTYGVFLMLAEKPRTIEETNAAVPPNDVGWTKSMVHSLVEASLVAPAADNPQRYQITAYGQRVRAALDQIPQAIKDEAWRKNWLPTNEELREMEATNDMNRGRKLRK